MAASSHAALVVAPPSPAAGGSPHLALRRQLEELQLDLDVDGALSLVRALQAELPVDLHDNLAVEGLARKLLRGLTTAAGEPVCWPAARPGQSGPVLRDSDLRPESLVCPGFAARRQAGARRPS